MVERELFGRLGSSSLRAPPSADAPAASAADHPRLRRGPRPKSRIFRISGSHKSRYSQILSARPVPIVLSRREEAIDVSHARIRAPIRKLVLLKVTECALEGLDKKGHPRASPRATHGNTRGSKIRNQHKNY
ncbi:hypothetical protein DdX_16278 [Ditylenchus destructor]|uniref:Uncharacterized protein n=1 Tax=Ditylenchus destructor TaxID=166010 RepID=A0AAD4QU48_9BILA|nr:hypothetical protein DdX_16278 [Ditylenchus destructor]